IQLNTLHTPLCKNCRTRFGFCRRLLRTNMSPFHCRRPFFAESKIFATRHAALTPVSCSVVPQNQSSPYGGGKKTFLQILSLRGPENNSSRYQPLRFCLSTIPNCR